MLGPLHEDDRVVSEERVEQAGVLAAHPGQPVEVEVRHGAVAAVVQVADDERRRRDRALDAQAAQCAAHERRLPRPELARHEHDVAGREVGGEPRPGALGLVRPAGQLSRRRTRSVRPAPSSSAPAIATGQPSMPV